MAPGCTLSRSTAALALLALLLAGCGGGSGLPNPADISLSKTFGVFSSDAAPDKLSVKPTTASDLVSADGACPGGGTEGTAASGAVGLTMTECEVVAAAGAPDKVDISAGQAGQRAVVLTYLKGERAGIYHFADGRLKEIESIPTPEKPAKPVRKKPVPKKPAAKKPARAPKPAPARQPAG